MPDDVVTPPAPAEILLWKGRTSQWLHFWYYCLCVLLAAAALAGVPFTHGWSAAGLALPLVLWLVQWWLTRATTYELTSQRLRVRRGILNRRLDELELYRVKDYVLEQPLFLRLCGCGNLTLVTSDASSHTVMLRAIARAEEVREQLRAAVQSERDRKRVRELDVDDVNPSR